MLYNWWIYRYYVLMQNIKKNSEKFSKNITITYEKLEKKYIKIFKLPEEKHFVNSRWILEKPATKKKRSVELQLYIYIHSHTHSKK